MPSLAPTCPTTAADTAERPRFLGLALACLVAFSLAPVALVELPAMVDYPNHLARMSILARDGTSAAHPSYQVAWAPYANLAMDLTVPTLARLVGVETATRLFYALSQLLVVSGAMALSFAVRRRVVAAAATACLLLYAIPFAFGFINFEFALGLALWGIAGWIAIADRPLALRLAVHAALVVVLYFSHLIALGIYGFAIGLVELHRLWKMRAWSSLPGLRHTAILATGMAAPALLVASFAASHGGSVGGSGTVWHPEAKLMWLMLLNGFNLQFSAVLTIALLGLGFVAVRRRWVRLVGAGPWIAAGFGLLFLALPFRLFDTGFVDGRILLALLLILPAFLVVEVPEAGARRLATAAPAAILAANLGFVAWSQLDLRRDYREVIAALETMPRGARLLPAHGGEAADPPENLLDYPLYHAATFAVHTRDAFVPTLFISPGKQPLRVDPALRHLTVLEGGPIPLSLLELYAGGRTPPGRLSYVANWTRDFDYVLLLEAPAAAPLPDVLEPLRAGRRFALYRVKTRIAP